MYTSDLVERKFTEIKASSNEVASSLLLSKMDIKAVQGKVGSKPASDFLSGLSLWDAVQKLVSQHWRKDRNYPVGRQGSLVDTRCLPQFRDTFWLWFARNPHFVQKAHQFTADKCE